MRATPGDTGLADLAVPLTRQTLSRGQPAYLHALFDAGAGKSDAGVRALWDLVDECHPRLDVTLRACRYPHRSALWKALPRELFAAYTEPGPYVGAPKRRSAWRRRRRCSRARAPSRRCERSSAGRWRRGPKKDRWHPLFTTADSAVGCDEVLSLFRRRQHHEQAYRVGVYDEFLDAVPCGYDKDSPDPKRPRWQRGPLQMIGWLVALVYNAVADLAGGLAGDFSGQPRADAAADVLQPTGDAVPDPRGADRKPGPVQGPGGVDPGDRRLQRARPSLALAGEPSRRPLHDTTSSGGTVAAHW